SVKDNKGKHKELIELTITSESSQKSAHNPSNHPSLNEEMINIDIPEYILSPTPVSQDQASEDAQLSVSQDQA
ncbi:4064_t:CDS:1, partial [Ambispora gerdemannii]